MIPTTSRAHMGKATLRPEAWSSSTTLSRLVVHTWPGALTGCTLPISMVSSSTPLTLLASAPTQKLLQIEGDIHAAKVKICQELAAPDQWNSCFNAPSVTTWTYQIIPAAFWDAVMPPGLLKQSQPSTQLITELGSLSSFPCPPCLLLSPLLLPTLGQSLINSEGATSAPCLWFGHHRQQPPGHWPLCTLQLFLSPPASPSLPLGHPPPAHHSVLGPLWSPSCICISHMHSSPGGPWLSPVYQLTGLPASGSLQTPTRPTPWVSSPDTFLPGWPHGPLATLWANSHTESPHGPHTCSALNLTPPGATH